MLKRIHLIPALFSLFFLVPACEPGEEPVGVPASIEPRSTELGAEGGSIFVDVTAAGDWTIMLEFPGGTSSWATVDPSSGSGSRSDVRLRYDANDGSESRSVTLMLKAGSGPSSRATVVQKGKDSGQGSGGSGGHISGKDTAAPLWLELPATKAGDGLTFYAHDMEGGEYLDAKTSGVRNWSFYWDAQEHLSLWVAYPLNNKLKGTGKRTDEWGFDTLIPSSEQPDLIGHSYGGGWTRGHQLPSADRLLYKPNVSTFYSTNMTPQEYNFNGGIWADLENRVRAYANLADTLYVVTGCLYAESTNYTGGSSGFYVKIPTHYFKALLFKGVSTYAPRGYMAAGFLLPHDEQVLSFNYLDFILSIDALENATGIDFFPNLRKVLSEAAADEIEAEKPSAWWK